MKKVFFAFCSEPNSRTTEYNKLTDDEVDALVDAAIETILVGAKIADFGSFSFEEADAGQELIVFYEELL